MKNEFQILAQFLEHYDGEVEGRSADEPTPEVQTRLRRFAQGTLPEKDRSEIISLLRDHPQWVSLLATEVKSLRVERG